MNPFGMMWAAMKRFATSLNRFSDEVDAMTGEVQARRLGFAPGEVIDGKIEPAPAVEHTNGAGRRKAAAS